MRLHIGLVEALRANVRAERCDAVADRAMLAGVLADGHAVVIAGGGPTGLLGGRSCAGGDHVAIVERRASQDLPGSRAGGLHSRTIEVLDQRGIADRFLSQGQVAQVAGFSMIPLDISDFPTRHPYGLGLWQNRIERILADWVEERAVPIYYRREVSGFAQDGTGVYVELSDGRSLRAEYLVGCDEGELANPEGSRYRVRGMGPDYQLPGGRGRDGPGAGVGHPPRRRRGPFPGQAGGRGAGAGTVREQHAGHTSEATLRDLREVLTAVYGTDYRMTVPPGFPGSPILPCRPSPTGRRLGAAGWRRAHAHSPVGGQGLNTGVQDAVNLGWKLAQVVNEISPESLLDTYHAERHPVPLPACCRPPWRKPCLLAATRALTPCATPCSAGRAWGAAAQSGSPRLCPAWTTTTSARDTRCSGAACPTSSWRPPAARCGSSPWSSPTHGRCRSTSVSPAALASPHGRIGSESIDA